MQISTDWCGENVEFTIADYLPHWLLNWPIMDQLRPAAEVHESLLHHRRPSANLCVCVCVCVYVCVRVFVCLSLCVCTLKGKQLELSTPKSVDIYRPTQWRVLSVHWLLYQRSKVNKRSRSIIVAKVKKWSEVSRVYLLPACTESARRHGYTYISSSV